ncbi:MAG: hypothetical protein U5J63_05200 [Fodinibius sp.]|nr:hypothetical protein [Fodinibius sp.]
MTIIALDWETKVYTDPEPAENIQGQGIIPGKRQRYLSNISETIRDYHSWAEQQVDIASKLDQVTGTIEQVDNWNPDEEDTMNDEAGARCVNTGSASWTLVAEKILEGWDELYEEYRSRLR